MKKNLKQGFTLIELLAVIVILSVIALISTPIIIGVIDKAQKGANKNSANGVFEAANLYYVNSLISGSTNTVFECNGVSCTSGNEKLEFDGKTPDSGKIFMTSDGILSGWVKYDDITYSYVNGQIVENAIITNNTLYSWDEEYYTDALATDTFSLLSELNINTIYQNFSDLYIDDEENIADQILNKGYTLYDLVGDSSWYNNATKIKEEIDNVYNYNIRKNNKILGIVLDIEFYTLEEYKNNPNNVISTLVSTYKEAANYAHSKNINIIFCLPYWLDSEHQTELEEIVKISDGISIMNYNRSMLIDGISKEVELAKKYGKKIDVISEFQNLGDNNLSYYNDGIDKALEDWKIINDNYNYSKMSFSFHYLNTLLELRKKYKTYEYIVKDSKSNIVSEQKMYVKVISNNKVTNFKKLTNSNGIVSVELPSSDEYNIEVSFQNYEVASNNQVSNTEKLSKNNIVLGNIKDKYTIEYYFKLIENGTKQDFKSKDIILYSKDTGETFARKTSSDYGYISLLLNYDETYYIKVYGDNNYIINVGSEIFDESTVNNTFTYKKEDGNYFPGDVYLKPIK